MAAKRNRNEKKFESMEEARQDALEMEKEEDEKAQEGRKARQVITLNNGSMG